MRAWKPPKYRPMMSACFARIFCMERPLQTETAKASMERPAARRNNSISDIRKSSCFFHTFYVECRMIKRNFRMIQKETCLQKKACRQVSSFAISLCIKQNQMRMHQCVGSAPGCCLATTPLSSAYSTQQSGSWSMLTILKGNFSYDA